MTDSKRPTGDALILAAEWLDAYEGDGGDTRESVEDVAGWLRWLASDEMLRREARRIGVPIGHARRALKGRFP